MSNSTLDIDFNKFTKLLQVHFNYRFFQNESKIVYDLVHDSSMALQEREEKNKSLTTSKGECAICFSDIYKSNECIFPCKHRFHIHCII